MQDRKNYRLLGVNNAGESRHGKTAIQCIENEILEILKDGNSYTSSQIGPLVNSQKTNTCDAMLRLLDQGLVTREPLLQNRVGRPRFEYKVSPRGLGRLKYLKAQKARALNLRLVR